MDLHAHFDDIERIELDAQFDLHAQFDDITILSRGSSLKKLVCLVIQYQSKKLWSEMK